MNLDAFRDHQFEPIQAAFSDKDTMLYALSLGLCQDPVDSRELPFVYEKNLVALPSMSAVLAHPGAWITAEKFGVNWVKLLHGEQSAEFHRPLPPAGTLRAEFRIQAVVDKGAEKGALVYFDKLLFDAGDNSHLCTVSATYFLRADGGAGGFGEAPEALPAVPERAPDFVDEIGIGRRAALLYRLNGDRNPIHADPEMASKAGFETPLLHGLCTYGICGYSVLRKALDYDVTRMGSLGLRFSSPVFPGESLRVEGWETGQGVAFQATVTERRQRVVSNGFAALAA
jgi:acyl dehydratase